MSATVAPAVRFYKDVSPTGSKKFALNPPRLISFLALLCPGRNLSAGLI